MSRPRPSSSLGFFSHDDEDADGPSRFPLPSTEQPSFVRRGSFNLFRRRSSQLLDFSSMHLRGDRYADEGDHGADLQRVQSSASRLSTDIGQAPTPSKPPKARGLGLRKPEGNAFARFGGSVVNGGAAFRNRSPLASPTLNDDVNAMESVAPARKGKSFARRVLSPRNDYVRSSAPDEDDSSTDPPRTSSALDFYRRHGPMQGLASKDWLPQQYSPVSSRQPSTASRSVSQTSTQDLPDAPQDIGKSPERRDTRRPGQSRPRSLSLTMANLVRRPSMRSSQTSAAPAPPQDERTSNAPQDDDVINGDRSTTSQDDKQHDHVSNGRINERPSRPPTSPSARFQPQSISRNAATPFLNTFTAKAYRREKSSAPPVETEAPLAAPRRKGLPAALRPRGGDNAQRQVWPSRPSMSSSRSGDDTTVPEPPTPERSYSTPGDPSSPEPAAHIGQPHKLRHLRSPSVSALDEMPTAPQPRSAFRSRLQSQDFGAFSKLTSRLPSSPASRKQTESLKATNAQVARDAGSGAAAWKKNGRTKEARQKTGQFDDEREQHMPRPSSPFGMHANTSLQTLGTHIGGMGAAVGRRGWDFVRNWGGAPSHAQSVSLTRESPATNLLTLQASRAPSNAATAAWFAVLDDGDKSPARPSPNHPGPRTGLLFGAPLRDAVLRTRLGQHGQSQASSSAASISTSDSIGTSYRLQLRGAGPSMHADQEVRTPANREEARLKYLPAIVVRCIEAVERWGFDEEGIYRLSGRSSHTSKLQYVFDTAAPSRIGQAGDLDLATISPADLDLNSVCSVLKSYLRALPDTIIPRAESTHLSASLSKNCGISSAQFSATDASKPNVPMELKTSEVNAMLKSSSNVSKERLCETLKPTIDALPTANWYLLRELALHLFDMTREEVVQSTRMPLSNLCLVLAPTLSLSVPVVQALVQHVNELFKGPPPVYDADLDDLIVGPPSRNSVGDESRTSEAPSILPRLPSSDLPVSSSSNEDSNRLSVATVRMDENRQSIASASTVQHEQSTESRADSSSDGRISSSVYRSPQDSPLPPVAAKFLRSPSTLSLHSPKRLTESPSQQSLHEAPPNAVQIGAESSSADSSLPSSYWTGGDYESIASSTVTDDNCSQKSPGLVWSLPRGLGSNASTTSLSGDRSESMSSISGRGSALDRPRPPTRGGASLFLGATRIVRPSRYAASRDSSSAMSSSASASSTSSSLRNREMQISKREKSSKEATAVPADESISATDLGKGANMGSSLRASDSTALQEALPPLADKGESIQEESLSAQSTPVL